MILYPLSCILSYRIPISWVRACLHRHGHHHRSFIHAQWHLLAYLSFPSMGIDTFPIPCMYMYVCIFVLNPTKMCSWLSYQAELASKGIISTIKYHTKVIIMSLATGTVFFKLEFFPDQHNITFIPLPQQVAQMIQPSLWIYFFHQRQFLGKTASSWSPNSTLSYIHIIYGLYFSERTEHGNDVIFKFFCPLFSAI